MTSTTTLGLPLYASGESGEDWCKGINFSGNSDSAFKKIDDFATAIKGSKGTVTLLAANWVNNSYTITLASLTSDSDVWFKPSTEVDQELCNQAGMYVADPVGTSVTITVKNTPSSDINLSYSIRG